ncbi:hypothetical protein NESM_000481200 [Novymonas esmeraldas]|uniref:C2 domain-containing protein n=1 Tax=Novymonas esmeraldas TaxID=1808958 RepID=A0AAW0EPZ8_9TRYP
MQRRSTTATTAAAAAAVAPHRDVEDRLQRALHENSALKLERNDLQERLKKLQTQFRRLAADWRQTQDSGGGGGGSGAPSVRPHSAGETASSLATSAAPTSGAPPLLPVLTPKLRAHTASGASSAAATPLTKQTGPSLVYGSGAGTGGGASEAELAACKAALAHTQLELQQVRAAAAAAGAAAASAVAAAQARAAAPQIAGPATAGASAVGITAAQQEANNLRAQLQQVREELNAALLARQQMQTQSEHTMQALQQQVQGTGAAQQQLEAQHRAAIDALTHEKQQLSLKVRLMEAERQASVTAPVGCPDPAEVATLQAELHRKASEVALLSSRLQHAQAQVETLKGECTRLIAELKTTHTDHADTKKALFALEHEAAALRARCGSQTELELSLQSKTAENVGLEQELLKMVSSLQACQRETEAAVRLDFQSRLADVQEMRDAAERERREAERRLLSCQHDMAELRRRLETAQEDVLLYRGEAAKAEKERGVLSAQIAFAGHTATAAGTGLSDDDVHRALAVAAIRRRDARASAGDGSADGASRTTESAEALELFEALRWDGDWEQGQLREALATAAMDIELAETRCQQMSEQVEQSRALLRRVSEERDMLLEESIALRGRVTHVQSIFARQQLQAYRTARDTGGCDGLIAFSIRALVSEEAAMCRALGIPGLTAPVSVFFTLEGLADYEAMVGPTLHSLDDVVDVRFQYEGLAKDAATLACVEQTTFVLQMHAAAGDTSRLVAMAELPGTALLSAREAPVEDTLTLIDGEGQSLGSAVVEFCCLRLVLPILLGAPLADPRAGGTALSLSALEIKSAMVALRAVRYLRIQVFRAEGLGGGVESTGAAPQPYVFYTATSPLSALSCVRDTVVRPSSRAFTADPVFDAAPVDHRVVVDASLIRFVATGVVSFVVFDERAADVQANLGVAEVALRALLDAPHATIRLTERLHPQGSLSVGLSWVSGA